MTAKTAQPSPEPPAAAVAADAHWSATREKLRNRHRPIVPMTICDDLEVKKAYEEAKFVLRRVSAELEASPGDAGLKRDQQAAQKALDAAKAAYDDVAIVLRFQAMRGPDFEDLKKQHPPTELQAEDGYAVNPDTIAPALIQACSLDGITAEDATYYRQEWAEGEANALFTVCWNLQTNVRMDLGKG